MTADTKMIRVDQECIKMVTKIAGLLQSKVGRKVTMGEAATVACGYLLQNQEDPRLQEALKLLDHACTGEAPPENPMPSKKKAGR